MRRGETRCPTCGAKTVEYPHTMSAGLISGLFKLAEAGGGPINIKHLNLTRNQWDNFQKLRYWDLVIQCDVEGEECPGGKTGIWKLTPHGADFICGKVSIQKRVWTYRGEVVERDGDFVMAAEVWADIPYLRRGDYAAHARPVNFQEKLF